MTSRTGPYVQHCAVLFIVPVGITRSDQISLAAASRPLLSSHGAGCLSYRIKPPTPESIATSKDATTTFTITITITIITTTSIASPSSSLVHVRCLKFIRRGPFDGSSSCQSHDQP